MKYPQRHENHSLEEESANFFKNYLPGDWNPNSIDRDYGQDLNLEIAEDGQYKGLELIVQLKASAEPTIVKEYEIQNFKVSTYNYLNDNLRVVMIVKYIKSEKEAYWTLLKDIPEPNQKQETFTIKIPRANRLTQIQWTDIVEYVRTVTDKKLASMRVIKSKNYNGHI